MRISASTLWLAVPLVALLFAVVLTLSPARGTLQAAEPSRATPADYVSSDPSLPSAASVQFPEATPHIEAF
jgi:hypothetical protein